MRSRWLWIGALWVVSAAPVDWPQFRGPNSSGVAETTGLPVKFGPRSNVIWKTSLPSGASSPVLAGSRIYITGFEEGELRTICLDRASGKILWRQSIAQPRTEKLHPLNSPASATPATDGVNAYVFFGDFGLVSYGRDGNERWRMPLGPFSNLHGMAASPVVAGDKLIVVCDQDTNSYIMAIEKDSGRVLWRIERPEMVHGFATPNVLRPKTGPAQVIVPGSYQLIAYSLENGEKLWWVRGLTWQVKATATIHGETIYATGWAPGADAGQRQLLPPFEEVIKDADSNHDGKLSPQEVPTKLRHSGSWEAIDLNHDGLLDARDWSFYRARRASQNVTLAIRPGNGRGDLTETHVVWSQDRVVPQVSSPLLYKGLLYTIKDGGIFAAFDPETGALQKQARLPDVIDSYYSSPVAADGKIFLASESGKITVIKPGAEWETLGVNDLDEPCYATPAIADGRIFIRTRSKLYCFGVTSGG